MSRRTLGAVRNDGAPNPARFRPRPAPLALALHLLLTGGTATTAGWIGGAQAQTQAQAVPQEAAAKHYDIPAGPLGAVLARFAAESGVLLAASSELVQGRSSPGLGGSYTAQAAIEALLAGTGLEAVLQANGTYALQAAPAAESPHAAAGEQVMPTVRVTAPGTAETATGPAAGYAARRSATGTKTDTPIVEIPRSLSVVTRGELDAHGAADVTEAMRYVPGVQSEAYGSDARGFDWFYLRGFDALSTNDYRDGLRQFGIEYAYPRTEAYGLERIEVLRGPASAMYGRGDAGGVINRVSKQPGPEVVDEVEAQFGSFDHKQIAGDAGGSLNAGKTLLYRLVGLVLDSGTQDKYAGGPRVKNDQQYIAPSLSWRPSEDTSLTVLADFLHNDTAGFAFSWTTPDNQPTRLLTGEPAFNKFEQTQATLGYRFEHRFDAGWTFRQNLRAATTQVAYRLVADDALEDDGRTLDRSALVYDEHVRQLVTDNQLETAFDTGPFRHRLLLGIDWLRALSDIKRYDGAAPSLDVVTPVYGQPVATPSTLDTDYDETQDQLGFYLQDQARLGRWLLTLGGRHDRVSTDDDDHLSDTRTDQHDTAFSGSAGLSYQTGIGIAPYFRYAESFLPQAGVDFGGRPFDPTRGRQLEAGVKYQPADQRLLLTAAVFDLRKTNVRTPDPDHAGYRVQTGEIRSRGLELEAKATLSSRLSFTAAYTYNDVKVIRSNDEDLGKTPVLVPRNMASAWLDYTIRRWGLGAGVRYVGPRYDDDLNTVTDAAYTLFDAAIRYEQGPWRFMLSGQNLTDKDYVANCNFGCYRGLERTVTLSAKYRWE